MISKEEARERVDLGAARLSQADPGWHLDINEDELDMTRNDKCILGQLSSDYVRGLELLFLPEAGSTRFRRFERIDELNALAVAHGFQVPEFADRDYPVLREAWLDVVHALKAGVSA